MKKKKLFLLDVYPILYRSHFAMQHQHLYTTGGLNTSAILGFCNYIFQIIFKEKPAYIAAAFDSYSFERTSQLGTYKATREKMPEDIAVAKDYVTRVIDALNIKVLHFKGYEADDVIGTIAVKAAAQGDIETFIVSPDKDFAQLVNDSVYLYRPSYQGINFDILDAEKVKGKYGVLPLQIADLLALKGDPVDNIPGVPKIGEKTAIDLLDRYQSVEGVLENRMEISKPSIRQTLLDHEDQARLSKSLALINTQLPLTFHKDEFLLRGPDTDKLVRLLDELEFVRLKERIFSNTFYKKFFHEPSENLSGETDNDECRVTEVQSPGELGILLQKIRSGGEFHFLATQNKGYVVFDFLVKEKAYHFQCKTDRLPEQLQEILLSDDIVKVTYQSKPIRKVMIRNGKPLPGSTYDVLLKHYILSPDANHQLDKIIAQELGVSIGPGVKEKEKTCRELQQLKKLKTKWESDPAGQARKDLYCNIDLPLVNVIARMELNGIRIDREALNEISLLFKEEIGRVEQRIFEIAGYQFNLNSSRQTADLLSGILKNGSVRKTKTGQFSTSEATLNEYAGKYEIARQLLRFRKLSKLVSTYTESLPAFIDPDTGRVHAGFLQVNTATGRLSCTNPNLQNLPIRSEEGREVRRAVIPENDEYLILSADYSQIELRLLAGLSKDEGLREAFLNQEDVHTATAAKVFNIPEQEVTDEMRSKAKMVNYGIAYGISPFGLSQRLKISMSEAKEIIQQYFLKFPGIKHFIDTTILKARECGYTETLTGRRRYIEDINSGNGTERRAAERIAINAPIQGLAADLIKLSMIRIEDAFQQRKLRSRMIMQVHDELVFEVYQPELKEAAALVKEIMESSIDAGVPLEVNLGVGENWLDLVEYKCQEHL